MIIAVKVKPGVRSEPKAERLEDGSFVVSVRERAKEGEANLAMIRLMAKYFGVAKSSVVIKSGHNSRVKRVEIDAK